MKILVIDGQGGGVGKALVSAIKHIAPAVTLTALGTNAAATAAMLRAGADQGATGENAVTVCASEADVILGPLGLVLCDAMLGEITPAMAQAVGRSPARKILIPMARCQVTIAGAPRLPLQDAVNAAVAEAVKLLSGNE